MKLEKKAFAKVNLSLDIVSKMDDGYHSLKTVMQSVGIYDEVTIECVPGAGISVDTVLPYVPSDERNVAVKAAAAFFDNTGISGIHTNIEINKGIPISAGLGGGSADAACVLSLLDEIFETKLSNDSMESIGLSVGADVPFCLRGGTCLAKGRGEILTQLREIPKCKIVICKPSFSCSTTELFGRVKCKDIRERPDTDGLLKAIADGELLGIARRMYNVFENILPRGKLEVYSIKGVMLENGALGAVMTGSGPAVLGLFDNEQYAKAAYESLLKSYSACFLTENVNGKECRA